METRLLLSDFSESKSKCAEATCNEWYGLGRIRGTGYVGMDVPLYRLYVSIHLIIVEFQYFIS